MITWGDRAAGLLTEALSQVRDGLDAIPVTEHALAALRVEAGELDPAELDPADACSCPPDLRARGGWRSSCLVHGTG
jgi:hypothetical protein